MEKRIFNPLADPIFKKVFGESAPLLMSLINAILQLEDPVQHVEYLSNELVPDSSHDKSTIVDVRCTDSMGRHFIVEMQIGNHASFLDRMLYNAAKVYSGQLRKGLSYQLLQPVFAISILDDVVERSSQDFMQRYSFMHQGKTQKIERGINLVILELSKCRKRAKFDMENALDRWIQYFISPEKILAMGEETVKSYPELWAAVDKLDTTHYTEGQMRAYEQHLDSIRLYIDREETNIAKGIEIGIERGLQQGLQQGADQGRLMFIKELPNIITDLKQAIMSLDEISVKYNLPVEDLKKLAESIFP